MTLTPWRVVFMGTPEFAVPALRALLTGPDEVVGVFTQPDKPVGRGMKTQPTPVKEAARAAGIPVFQPRRLRDPETVGLLRELRPDLVVVVAYGQILSREVLELPRLGCINIHASLLPRWRGAAPIQRCLQAGDRVTGITIMQMDEGLDTGPMLLWQELSLPDDASGGWLHDQLAERGGPLLLQALEQVRSGKLQPVPQPEEGVTYAHKLLKEEARVDWGLDALTLQRQIRAFDPWPGSWTLQDGQHLKLLASRVAAASGDGEAPPGQVLALHADGPEVACGQGSSLVLTRVQPANRRAMNGAEWLHGRGVVPGQVLGH
ncbi:MAG: methionyl-tRNA formyltransferase [Magnetococcus sp. WYHC-3]